MSEVHKAEMDGGMKCCAVVEQIGDTRLSICCIAAPWMPTCEITQGPPGSAGSTEEDCSGVDVTEDGARMLIEALQQWLQDRAAYKANEKLPLEIVV